MFFYYVSCESLVPHTAPRVQHAGWWLSLGWSWCQNKVGFLPPSLRIHPRGLIIYYLAATFHIDSTLGYFKLNVLLFFPRVLNLAGEN